MDSNPLSKPRDENAIKEIDVIEARWSQLDQTAEFYSDRKVCQSDAFESDIWDFRREGVDRLLFDSIIGQSGREFLPMKLLLKLVAFVLLGFNARFERSYRTAHNILSGSKQFIQWLISRKYLVATSPNGYFKLPSDLQSEELRLFIDSVAATSWHDNTKLDKVRFLSEWWKLSYSGDYLPACLRLASDPFDGQSIGDLLSSSSRSDPSEDDDDDQRGWLPIPLEFAFPMAKKAVEYIEAHADALIRFYEVVYEGIVGNKSGSTVTRGRVLKECAARGITLEQLGENLPFLIEFTHYAPPSDKSRFTYRMDRKVAEKAFSYIKRAAVLIILFTTGIRARELRNLKVGCCVRDYRIGVNDFYRMTVTIQKTSTEYIAGHVVTLPVPKITFLAVKLLEVLGRGNRRGDILIAPLQNNEKTDHVTGPVAHQSIINHIQDFCEDSGIDYRPHPHQFRKTIAGWFALNSPVLGPLLVMTLFSHKKLSMTEMYLRNNPFIRSARQEMLVEQSLKLVKNISHALQSGKVAGVSGDRLMAGVKAEPRFEGLTGDKLGTSIEEYLRERALYGSMHFLLTPFVICVIDPDDTQQKPCTQLIAKSGGIGDDVASIGLPTPSTCVGAKCEHCLLTECESASLEQSLEFYRELIQGVDSEGYSQNLHLLKSAREFVAEYTPLLEQIK
ncbi:site-specific integrase [Pseudomonas sp. GB2N2]